MLRAAFVRVVGERDRIYVTRSDGSEVGWAFPTYGDSLPHDLVHLVVESAFGLRHGFWGRVDEGVNPQLINDQANRMGGANKFAGFGADQDELVVAEALAAARWWEDTGRALEGVRAACESYEIAVPALSLEQAERTARALALLRERWRRLLPKGTLNLAFDSPAPQDGFDRLCQELAVVPTAAGATPSR